MGLMLVLPTILSRGGVIGLIEFPEKGAGASEACIQGNLSYGQIRGKQQITSVFQALGIYIIGKGGMQLVGKKSGQGKTADTKFFGKDF